MRMHADTGEDILMTLGDFDGQSIVLDRSDRTNRDDLYDAGGGCARDHVFDLVAEFRVREMTMRIDDCCHTHTQANSRYLLVASHCRPAQRDLVDRSRTLIHVEYSAVRAHGRRDKRNVNSA